MILKDALIHLRTPTQVVTDMATPIRILHVEDNPRFRELTSMSLEEESDDFVVESVANVGEGLDRLSNAEFDCIVADYDLPESDGLDFLQSIREDHPDLPFILFTGQGSEEIASEAISAGVTEYMQKEDAVDQFTVLAQRIENCVAQHRAEQETARTKQRLEELSNTLNDCL